MAPSVAYLSLYLLSIGLMKLVKASDPRSGSYDFTDSSFLNFEAGLNDSHPYAFNVKPDLSSGAKSSKHVATRTDVSSTSTGTAVSDKRPFLQITPQKIFDNTRICKMICLHFEKFPIVIDGNNVKDVYLAKMNVHLDFIRAQATDVLSIMKACNDLTSAPCMSDRLTSTASIPPEIDEEDISEADEHGQEQDDQLKVQLDKQVQEERGRENRDSQSVLSNGGSGLTLANNEAEGANTKNYWIWILVASTVLVVTIIIVFIVIWRKNRRSY